MLPLQSLSSWLEGVTICFSDVALMMSFFRSSFINSVMSSRSFEEENALETFCSLLDCWLL